MTLAIHGGAPVRTKPFPAYRTVGQEEKEAVCRVIDSGVLSRFLGCWHEDFYGGPEIQALEQEWAAYFGVKHAMSVNSCTSGLYCAVGASGVEPGEEIIVSPYTMSASATAPLIFNAIPVFADVEPEYFCLDPASVEARITPRTRAILVVDIFGLPFDVEAIQAIARRHGLLVIEDAAQAPGARFRDRYAGTLGDIGVFSLNYHKHIHCGEGGIVVTDNDELAERVRLIRNHAEAVVEAKGTADLVNMIGFNFRMTEVEAAIARCQLRKLDSLLVPRLERCRYLSARLAEIPVLRPAPIRPECVHVHYVQPCCFDASVAGVSRDSFIRAVRAELPPVLGLEAMGAPLSQGYVKPLYLQPLFQRRIAYGKNGYPLVDDGGTPRSDYSRGLCPVVERLHFEELFYHSLVHPELSFADLDDFVAAFHKVWDGRESLR